jgi:hypothetical protein
LRNSEWAGQQASKSAALRDGKQDMLETRENGSKEPQNSKNEAIFGLFLKAMFTGLYIENQSNLFIFNAEFPADGAFWGEGVGCILRDF